MRRSNAPIDSSGELADGTEFHGALGLIEILSETKREQFVRCLTEKMLMYALGRELTPHDQCAVDGVVAKLHSGDYRFASLIAGIVESVPFQMSRTN